MRSAANILSHRMRSNVEIRYGTAERAYNFVAGTLRVPSPGAWGKAKRAPDRSQGRPAQAYPPVLFPGVRAEGSETSSPSIQSVPPATTVGGAVLSSR